MEYIISIFIFLFDVFSLINIVEAVFECKVSKKQKNITWAMLVIVSYFICNFILLGHTIYEAAVMIVLFVITINLSYYGNLMVKLFYSVLWYFTLMASEYIIITISMILFGVGIEGILADKLYFILFTVTSRFFIYFITFIFKKVRRNSSELTVYSWLQLILFPVFTLLTSMIFINVEPKDQLTTVLLLVDIIGLIITNVIALNILNRLDEEHRLKRDNMLLNQQINLEMKNVEALMDAYAVQRRITHDFENHLRVVKSLAEKNNDGETLEYTSQMLKHVSDNALIVHSNNNIVDAILNQKYVTAKKYGITISFKINDLSGITIANEDMVTFLANALDNAIEATKQCADNKFIKVTITNNFGELLINISNPVKTDVVVKNNIVESNNKGFEHGYGLQNIKLVTDKYNGILNIDCKNKLFTVSAILY